MKAELITTDGQVKRITVNTVKEAVALVCSERYKSKPEVLSLPCNGFLLFDHDGKQKHLPLNSKALELAQSNEVIYPHEELLGNVLYFFEDGDFQDLKSNKEHKKSVK